MKTEKLVDGIAKVADVAKTGVDLASSIEKCCDPNNKNKAESIVGIVGNGIMFGLKIGLFTTQICHEKEFKQQMNSSLLMLKMSVDSKNMFYKETYNTFHDIEQDRFNQIIADCDRRVSSEFSADRRVMSFWNLITAKSSSPISESDFDYGVSRIQEYDCAKLRQNNPQFTSQYIEQTVIPEYLSFMYQLFGMLKSELKTRGKIITL